MSDTQVKQFSKAELEHLKEKALNANMAIGIHNEFVAFLRQQHEAPEQEGWMLGAKGFELIPVAQTEPPPVLTGEGWAPSGNGKVDEQEGRLSIPL
jgi:hypothetical protein